MKKDVANNHFLKKPERVADLVNGFCFHGKQNIKPEDVKPYFQKTGNTKSSVKREQDFVFRVIRGANFLILGVENQNYMDPCMVLRSLEYTVLQYTDQRRTIRHNHEAAHDLTGDEYLSRFSLLDRLKPTIILVVYYGDKPWQGARTLHELLDWSDIPDEWRPLFADHQLHLLEVNKLENLEEYHTDLKLLFGTLMYRKNKEKMKTFINENKDGFEHISTDLLEVIGLYSHSKEVLNLIDNNNQTEEGGKTDMCQAFTEIIQDGIKEGIEEELKKRLPVEIEKRMPEELEKRIPQELEKRIPQELEKRIPQELEKRIPQELEKRITENNQRFSKLISTLLSENKIAELKKIAEDAVYREKVLSVYSN